MGRIEVTLGIDALLPLTEAGQCLLCMVHYFQSLLEKKKERSARVSLLWSAPITFVPGSSQVRWALGRCRRHLAGIWQRPTEPSGLTSALNTVILMTSAKRIRREELQDKNDGTSWDKYPLKKTLKYISKDRSCLELYSQWLSASWRGTTPKRHFDF